MAPRANWQGYLKLSLVSCAVALFPASSTRERVSFNTINRRTGNKVRRVYVDPDSGEEVGPADQVKGYPVTKERFVLVEDGELEEVRLPSAHTIDIEKFVPRAEIDPRFLDTPYYIAPNDKVAQEPFAVIRDAMRDAAMVGIGRVVIARRERIVMLEPLGRGLLGTVLRYAYEVRDADGYFDDIPDIALPAEMRDLAHVIIGRKSGHFDATAFTDRYEEALVALIQAKQMGEAVEAPAPRGDGKVVDLMEALRRSLGGPTGDASGAEDGTAPPREPAGKAMPARRTKAKTAMSPMPVALSDNPTASLSPKTSRHSTGRGRKAG